MDSKEKPYLIDFCFKNLHAWVPYHNMKWICELLITSNFDRAPLTYMLYKDVRHGVFWQCVHAQVLTKNQICFGGKKIAVM